jgi:hypothetical protein
MVPHPFNPGLRPFVFRVQLQHTAKKGQALAAGGRQPGQPEQSRDVIRVDLASSAKTAASFGLVAGVGGRQTSLKPGPGIAWDVL